MLDFDTFRVSRGVQPVIGPKKMCFCIFVWFTCRFRLKCDQFDCGIAAGCTGCVGDAIGCTGGAGSCTDGAGGTTGGITQGGLGAGGPPSAMSNYIINHATTPNSNFNS